jgi:hypothetical protein
LISINKKKKGNFVLRERELAEEKKGRKKKKKRVRENNFKK